MGVEQIVERTPVARSLLTRVLVGTAKYAGIAAAIVAGTYAAWRYGEAPADRERREAIEATDRQRAQNPNIVADQATVELQRAEALRNQNLPEQQRLLADIKAANPGMSNDAAQAKLRQQLADNASRGTGTLVPPAAVGPVTKTLVAGNETCEANGLTPLSAPSGSRFDALEVDCTGKVARDQNDPTKTNVTIQTFKRDGAGQIMFSQRNAEGLSLPEVSSSRTILAQISANGQAVTIPRDPAFAGADNLIVRLNNPSKPGTTIDSRIELFHNPAQVSRLTP